MDRPRMDDYKGTIYDFADTSKMRGAWMILMMLSAKADRGNMQEKLLFCSQIRTVQNIFPCSDCKEHFGEYISAHSPEAVFLSGNSLFDWVVGAMNEVQIRLKKPLYDIDMLYPMFHGSGVVPCTSTCSAGDKNGSQVSGATFTSRYRR